MIEARHFVEAARRRGFDWYAGVPCSYLTPFINFVLQERSLRYVSMANEGDAVAFIAGVTLAGRRGIAMMQNSGLGNAVSPLTSLTWPFRLAQLLIVTWRGQPGVADEPQHALMGPITPQLLDTMEIGWEPFPIAPDEVEPALDRALAHMDATGRPFALLMRKGSVAAYPLRSDCAGLVPTRARADAARVGDERAQGAPSRREALQVVIEHTPVDSSVVLASTGYCGRELAALEDRSNQLYMVGSMGCVLPLALGLALARPDVRVVAIDGDGAALMRLGAFATAGAYGPSNLRHLLLDNRVHDSTGGQATVSAHVSFAHIASACGYGAAFELGDTRALADWLDAPDTTGPQFARLIIRAGTPADLPRPVATPTQVRTRLMRHLKVQPEAIS